MSRKWNKNANGVNSVHWFFCIIHLASETIAKLKLLLPHHQHEEYAVAYVQLEK